MRREELPSQNKQTVVAGIFPDNCTTRGRRKWKLFLLFFVALYLCTAAWRNAAEVFKPVDQWGKCSVPLTLWDANQTNAEAEHHSVFKICGKKHVWHFWVHCLFSHVLTMCVNIRQIYPLSDKRESWFLPLVNHCARFHCVFFLCACIFYDEKAGLDRKTFTCQQETVFILILSSQKRKKKIPVIPPKENSLQKPL